MDLHTQVLTNPSFQRCWIYKSKQDLKPLFTSRWKKNKQKKQCHDSSRMESLRTSQANWGFNTWLCLSTNKPLFIMVLMYPNSTPAKVCVPVLLERWCAWIWVVCPPQRDTALMKPRHSCPTLQRSTSCPVSNVSGPQVGFIITVLLLVQYLFGILLFILFFIFLYLLSFTQNESRVGS